jgi:electron transport complex protein RnfC
MRFHGGLYLPPRYDLALPEKIVEFPPPNELLVPLLQHSGLAAKANVQAGQHVTEGQLIGTGSGSGAPDVHAPLAGRVTGLTKVDTARRKDISAIQIQLDKQEAERRSPSISKKAFDGFTIDELVHLADRAGLTDMRSPAEPLGHQLRRAHKRPITDLIINILPMEHEFSWCHRLLDVSDEQLAGTVHGLQKTLSVNRVLVAIDRKERRRAGIWRKISSDSPLQIVRLDNKYPQAHPVLLTQVITGRETPAGRDTIQAGVLVIDLSVVAALHNAVQNGFVFTHRPMMVAGPAVEKPGIYQVPVGTRVIDILQTVPLKDTPARVIDGGLMTGKSVENAHMVVTKETSSVIVLNHTRDWVGHPGPCVHCGWCQEDCPVSLDPQKLLEYYEYGLFAGAAQFHPEACIECGLCSYVCPAELPLTEAASQMKHYCLQIHQQESKTG